MNTQLIIRIDHREPVSEMKACLVRHRSVEVEGKTLPVGDLVVDDRLVFERKTLKDFAASVISGRLFSQVSKMVSTYLQPVLILEGKGDPALESHVSRNALQGALITVTLVYGIPVLRAMDLQETCDLVVFCGRQYRNIAEGKVKRCGYRPKQKPKRQQFILQGLPGVGPKRAKQLLDRFETIAGVCNASIDAFCELPGFRRKTAELIHDLLH